MICAAAAMPSIFGILMSQMTRSGCSSVARATACSPSLASPTTSKPSSRSISARSSRISASSSAISTRIGAASASDRARVRHRTDIVGSHGAFPSVSTQHDALCADDQPILARIVGAPAPVSQLVEEADSKPVQCGFESHRGHSSRIVAVIPQPLRARECGVRRRIGAATHMTPEEFRRYGREVVDWIADYYERIESLPVLSQVAPGDVRARAAGRPTGARRAVRGAAARPGRGRAAGHHALAAPVVLRATSPRTPADRRSSATCWPPGLGVQGMLWSTSPAATELETHVLDWLADLLDLPAGFRSGRRGGGVIQHSASDSALVALLAALHRVSGGRTEHAGRRATPGTRCTPPARPTRRSRRPAASPASAPTRCASSTSIRQTLAARPDHLRELLARDVADGVVPALVVASVGTTGTGAVDPVRELADDRPRGRRVDARRRRVGGRRGRGARAALAQRRPRTRRQLLHQPAQVAADELRLRRVLGGRPRPRWSARCRSCPSTCATPRPSRAP